MGKGELKKKPAGRCHIVTSSTFDLLDNFFFEKKAERKKKWQKIEQKTKEKDEGIKTIGNICPNLLFASRRRQRKHFYGNNVYFQFLYDSRIFPFREIDKNCMLNNNNYHIEKYKEKNTCSYKYKRKIKEEIVKYQLKEENN